GYILPLPNYLASFAASQLATTATAHATVSGGSVTTLVVDTPGSGYTSAPTVTLTTSSTATRAAIGAAASGGNADITQMTALTAVNSSVAFGGTQTFSPGSTTTSSAIFKGLLGQTAALSQDQTSTGAVVGARYADGRIGQGADALGTASFAQGGTFSPIGQASIYSLYQGQTLRPTVAGGQAAFASIGGVVDTSAAGATTFATATAAISGGQVTGVTVTGAGAGYTSVPTVAFAGGGATTNATGHATLSGTTVASVVVDTPGAGYTSAPAVIFATPIPSAFGLLIPALTATGGVNALNSAYGAYIIPPTGGASNYGLVVTGGNSGFGTTTPARTVDVVGTLGATGVVTLDSGVTQVDGSVWNESQLRIGKNSNFNGQDIGVTIQMQNTTANTGGTGVYEKAAMLVMARQADTSATYSRDMVGIEARGYIATPNPMGRAWGMLAAGYVETGADGFSMGIEIQSSNNAATDQAAVGTTTSKIGAQIVATGTQKSTVALYINGAGASLWHKGVWSDM
ncbi:MAG: hypothetical protein LC793_24850, partial [Thermomicrobia bacterium]|nr:hypothetical protein [Thermomicrobia bacterium]